MATLYGSNVSDTLDADDLGDEVLGWSDANAPGDEGPIDDNDTLRGGLGADTLRGGNGVDSLLGYSGIDRLFGGARSDFLRGGEDDDVLFGGGGNDSFLAEGGQDKVYGGDNNDLISVSFGQGAEHQIFGGRGLDTLDLDYFGNSGGVVVSIADPTRAFVMADGTRIIGIEQLRFNGGEGSDSVTGGAMADEFSLEYGNDTASGGGGSDTIYGESGNDLLSGRSGDDKLYGNDGRDRLFGGDGNDIISGDAGNDRIYGGAGNDIINVDPGGGDDIINGGTGIDMVAIDLRGSLTAVTVKLFAPTTVTTVGDVVLRNVERLFLWGSNLADTITGGAMADELSGSGGSDRLTGRGGADDIYGDLGMDTLTGGSGSDRFIFDSELTADNVDLITDFTIGTDRILLDENFFGSIGSDLAANQFHIGTGAITVDQRILYDSVTGALYYDGDGTGGEAAVWFATLDANLALTYKAFDLLL